MTKSLHKVAYIVPSDKRVEFERFAEEWSASMGVEIKHFGSWPFDPDKPQTVYRTAKPKAAAAISNGYDKPTQLQFGPTSAKSGNADRVVDMLSKERRIFSHAELSERLGLHKSTISSLCANLQLTGRIKKISRGLVQFA